LNDKKKDLGDSVLHYNDENIKKVKGRIKEKRDFTHGGGF